MHHHPAEEQLLDLALSADSPDGIGAPADASLLSHVSHCADCSARVRALREELADSLLPGAEAAPTAWRSASVAAAPDSQDTSDGSASVAASAIDLKSRVLRATTEAGPDALQGFVHRIGLLFDLDAAAVHKLLADAHGESAWELPGPIAFFHVQPGPRLQSVAEAGVVRLAPGMTFPRHRHRGDEHGLVLSGTLREDNTGKLGHPGDILFMPDGSTHTVTAVGDQTCLFVVLLYGGTPDIEWC